MLLAGVAAGPLAAEDALIEKWRPISRFYSKADIGSHRVGPVTALCIAEDGTAYAGADDLYCMRDGKWTRFRNTAESEGIRSLYVEGQRLWVGTNTGLRVYDCLTKNLLYTEEGFETWEINSDGMGTVVAATMDGIVIVTTDRFSSKRVPIALKARPRLCRTDEGLLVYSPGYAAVVDDGKLIERKDTEFGLLRFGDVAVGRSRILTGRNALPHNVVDPFFSFGACWDGLRVVGSMNQGIFVGGSDGLRPSALINEDQEVWCLTTSPTGELWVGTQHGIHVLFPRTRMARLGFTTFSVASVEPLECAGLQQGHIAGKLVGFIFQFLTDSFGRSYALGKTSIYENGKFKLRSNFPVGIVERNEGHLGVISMYSLDDYDLATLTPSTLQRFPVSPREAVMIRDFGTYVVFADNSIRLFRTPRGDSVDIVLPSSHLTRLFEADGRAFYSRGKGVLEIAEQIRPVGGLPEIEDAVIAGANGEFWVMGKVGAQLRVYHSLDLVHWRPLALPFLDRVGLAHGISTIQGWLVLSGSEDTHRYKWPGDYMATAPAVKDLKVLLNGRQTSDVGPWEGLQSVAATWQPVTKTDFEATTLEQRLMPVEQAWETIEGSSVSFPALKSGHYEVQLRTRRFGVAGELFSIPFRVRDAWYATPVAYSFLGVLICTSVAGLFFVRGKRANARREALEQEVALRTAQLAKASAAKDEFLASISHELRNPLNGIVGIARVLVSEAQSQRQSFLLEGLQSCSEQLRSTLDDVLEVAKIEEGRVTLDLEDFEIIRLVRGVCTSYDPPGLQLVFDIEGNYFVRGDAGKMRQVLGNLLSNALKYGVPPGGTIIGNFQVVGKNVKAEISVSSVGPELSDAQIEAIFEPFVRAAYPGSPVPGTGLGLTIARKLARAMGGDVRARSAGGSNVFIASFVFESISEVLGATPHPKENRKALAVEDERYNRLALGHLLSQLGFETNWAESVKSAKAAIQQEHFDLVVTDWYLSDGTGGEVIRTLREKHGERRPPVVVVSAYATQAKISECLEAGAFAFISKPVRGEKLAAVIHELFPQSAPVVTFRPLAESVNRAFLIEHFGEDAGNLLASDMRANCSELIRSWRSDRPAARSIAHRLQGQLSLIGAVAASDLISTVVNRDDSWGEIESSRALRELETQVTAICDVLKDSQPE